jgi:predicted CXXCH cytochrome family protein
MAHDKGEPGELADVPQDAYRRDSRVSRARVWLPAVAVLAVVVFAVVEFAGRGEVRYTPGSLAAVHATWDNQCDQCHIGAQPLGGQNWLAVLSDQTHAADDQCRRCHAGPEHHEKAERGPGCAACHREHQGRQAALTRMPDAVCTDCHADLDKHYVPDTPATDRSVYSVVTAFNLRDHPPFRKRDDPGTVAFNHKLHLSPGLSKVADPAKPYTVADLPKEFQDQYRPWVKADGSIQLDCAACHQRDARDGVIAPGALAGLPQDQVRPARTSGAYMAPILYERHCQACHPLTTGEGYTVRHRAQPGELTEIVRGYYTAKFFDDKLGVDPSFLKYPLPGKDPRRPDARQTAYDLIKKHVDVDRKKLLGANTCQKCHTSLQRDPSRVPPADIRQVWFQRAKFDHAAHTTVGCRDCHAGADTSQTHTDVLLPSMDICVRCHAPAGAEQDSMRSGARFDCVECHRYHNGDHSLHGR